MTIDEAIKQLKYDAECNRADLDMTYAEENEQIAEWLQELKFIRQWKADVMEDFCKYDCRHNSYNKAIDECIRKINELTCGCTQEVWSHTICSVLEQLKGAEE